jgi:hypothetical protein
MKISDPAASTRAAMAGESGNEAARAVGLLRRIVV